MRVTALRDETPQHNLTNTGADDLAFLVIYDPPNHD